MKHSRIFKAWRQILLGRRPALAIEITNKCPLSCPGCYAYQPNHVSGNGLKSFSDYSGGELVDRVLNLLDARRPQGLFLVGGEPLVRLRELTKLLPEVS
ncbi:MAG: 4Fe-4S cluster-binding domain-containing protein [bacterium]